MKKLTDRQEMVLTFIREYTALKGYPPTLREIGAHMGIKSTQGVGDHLSALERKGFVRRVDMISRGIVLVENDAVHDADADRQTLALIATLMHLPPSTGNTAIIGEVRRLVRRSAGLDELLRGVSRSAEALAEPAPSTAQAGGL